MNSPSCFAGVHWFGAAAQARQLMKTKIMSPRLLLILSGVFAAASASGQVIYTWTGGNGTGTELGAATNWGGTLPSTTSGDTAQWNGGVPGNLFLTYSGGFQSGFSASGITFVMTPNQTGSVNIGSPVAASLNLAILNLTNDSASAVFSLGDTTTKVLNIIWRPGNANQLHELVNNSANANIIYPNVRFQSGGGGNHILSFGGTGEWRLTNNLVGFSAATFIQKLGTGIMYWNGPSLGIARGTSSIGSPVTIVDGTLVLQNNSILSSGGFGTTGTQKIVNNGTLQYDAPAQALTLSGVISGTGWVRVSNGTLTLAATNTYTGSTEVTNNGTLVVRSVGGNLNLQGGTLVPGAAGAVSNLIVAGNLNISAGTVLMALNKSLSPSSSSLWVAGAISCSGGTLRLLNFGPDLVASDKFTLFNQPVSGGDSLTIVSPGFTVTNNLASDGSVTVISVAPSAIITPTLAGGSLNLSWPAAWTGLHLQAQTNSQAVGLSSNWFTVSATDATNNYATTLSPNTSGFYRLAP